MNVEIPLVRGGVAVITVVAVSLIPAGIELARRRRARIAQKAAVG